MGGLTGAILTGTLASPHVWDTGDGIGAWTGTAEGMEQHLKTSNNETHFPAKQSAT
jgi:hypothetical protein